MPPLATGWSNQDVGAVGIAGMAGTSGSTFTIYGSGGEIWGGTDELQYVYQPVSGDVTITAQVTSVQNTNGWAKAGVMIRETLDTGSKNALMGLTPSNGFVFQRRQNTGGATNRVTDPGAAPGWVRLVRSGSTFTGYRSTDGVTFIEVGHVTISMNSSVYIGLAVSSRNNTKLCMSVFDSVLVTTP